MSNEQSIELVHSLLSAHCSPLSVLHGDRSGQRRIASSAHAVDLSVWQDVQVFGILYLSVIAGEMKRNVWALTYTPAMVVSIWGIWHATHWPPALPLL